MTTLLTRRNFLERAGCAGALLAAARPAAAADGWFVSLNGSLTRGIGGAEKMRVPAAPRARGVGRGVGTPTSRPRGPGLACGRGVVGEPTQRKPLPRPRRAPPPPP